MKAQRLLTITLAAAALLAFSACKKDTGKEVSKPVVTQDMYSVTVDDATNAVTFSFNSETLTPFWKVSDPSGSAVDLGADVRSKNFTRSFTVNGLYTGVLIAFGDGGQSDPVSFTFSVGGGNVEISDPTKSTTWNILVSKTWKLYKYGYWGPEWTEDNIKLGLSIPSCLADDRLTFKADGTFILNQGSDKTNYDDSADQGIPTISVNVTGKEQWSLGKEGNTEYIQFSAGGFPSMLFGEKSVNARWDIGSIDANQVRIQFEYSEGEFIVLFLVDENAVITPENPGAGIDAATVESFVSGRSFTPSDYGYWGDGWESFDGEAPGYIADDTYTFSADGKFIMNLGETASVVSDGYGEVDYSPTGNETWKVSSEGGSTFIEFGGGGFPGVIASVAPKYDPSGDYAKLGVDGKWTVTEASGQTLRLEFYQEPQEQWVCIILTRQ